MLRSPEYSRRQILALIAAASTSTMIGCATENQSTINPSTPIRPEQTPIRPEGLSRLVSSIELITDPFIKKYLKDEILPIYQQSGPFIKDFNGLTFNIASGVVKTGYTNPEQFGGTFSFQTPSRENEHVTAEDGTYYIPALSTTRASERNSYTMIKGEPTIPFEVQSQASIFPELRPEIGLLYPGPTSRISSESILKIMQFVAVKESCSHMIFNSYLLNIASTMKRLDLQTHIKATNKRGEMVDANIVTQLVNVALSQQGRTLVLLDIGGAVLAFKALAGTGLSEANIGRTRVTQNTINAAAKEYLGGDIHTVFPTVVNFIMNNPAAEPTRYSYAGDLNKLP